MLTLSADQLTAEFARNVWVIHRHTDDVTQAESLIQPPFQHNCLNWVLGHIVQSRDDLLKLLGASPVLDEAEADRYQRGAEAVTAATRTVVDFARLRQVLDEQQQRLAVAFANSAADVMSRKVGDNTFGETIRVLYFHEAYHTGQIDILRQVAGKNDTIIK
ncbi:hypothetical protein BH10CHL1_BH10CHL1_46220 [soil metagenome]